MLTFARRLPNGRNAFETIDRQSTHKRKDNKFYSEFEADTTENKYTNWSLRQISMKGRGIILCGIFEHNRSSSTWIQSSDLYFVIYFFFAFNFCLSSMLQRLDWHCRVRNEGERRRRKNKTKLKIFYKQNTQHFNVFEINNQHKNY